MMEIYITYLLQILSFSSRFRRFEMKNFLRWLTMVADNISLFISTGLWHEGLLYKLRSMSIPAEIYNLENHLSARFQRIILNGLLDFRRGDQF